ncbi:hypothetical protein BDA96_02G018600 [Sorghum bicolor]|uniref:Rx N-terminal domain-containing protein n=1 Tax=Sorghum bicolor TaxID=4558 RepID=A0A921RKA9_SORBI|nr:hypothetical protein BDA96_02G018600 [Sorghum bicolor]
MAAETLPVPPHARALRQGRNARNTYWILMTEMVSSVVVQETVSQILSGLVHRYEGKEDSNPNDNLERLEMAHIKLEAALETSSKWQITDKSLLRWRKKLKRAAQECDDTLYGYKKIILEEEQMEQEVRNSSFPKRIAHATKSFIFSAFGRNNYESSRSVVRRFEWFADSASEFLRFIELGGTPSRQMSFNSFVKHLFAGRELQHKIVHGNEYPLFLLWLVPFATKEHGIEVCLVFIKKDRHTLEDNFFLGAMLQISESTDIVGTIVNCLQLFPSYFQPIVETIKKELTQLPTQDFSWVPYVDLWHRKHWDNLHSFSTQWFRPDPLCCKQHDQHKVGHISNLGEVDASLDSIIVVNLQCQISLSEYNKQRTSLSEHKYSLRGHQKLKAGLLFTPHGSSENMLPANRSSTMAPIFRRRRGQHCEHTDITLEQLKEIILPKAINYFQQNTEATVYQILWKAIHGTAYINFGKPSMEAPGPQRTFRGARKRKLVQQKDQELQHRTHMISHLIDLWGAHAPLRLQGLILDWIQKEKENQLEAPVNHCCT